MSTEIQPTAVQPVDDVVLMFLGTDADFRSRLEQSLDQRKIPAVLMEDVQRGDFRPIVVRFLADAEGEPLLWATHADGSHGLEPFAWTDLVSGLSRDLDCFVGSELGLYGGVAGFPWEDAEKEDSEAGPTEEDDADGGDVTEHDVVPHSELADEIAAFDAAFIIESITWYTPGNTDIVSVLARRAGEPFAVCAAGSGYVAASTVSPDSVFEEGVWASKGGLFLARSAGRRGAGYHSKRDPLVVHWWDEAWTRVDPSKPWEVDSEGRRVSDHLDLLLPETEPWPWIENFGLDGERAEEVRILLRKSASDESTFDRLVTAIGLPALLADVASDRVRLVEVDGARTIQPGTFWQAMKSMAHDEWQRPVELPAWMAPLASWQKRWQERRRRRSVGYLALMGVGFAVMATLTVAKVANGADFESLWWRVGLLAYCVLDVAWPRRASEPEQAGLERDQPNES